MNPTDDDYYYDSFVNYKETTNDPGPWMLIGVLSYSGFCVLLLPVLVWIHNRRMKNPLNFQRLVHFSSTDEGEIEVVTTKGENKTRYISSVSIEPAYESNNENNGGIINADDEISNVSSLFLPPFDVKLCCELYTDNNKINRVTATSKRKLHVEICAAN